MVDDEYPPASRRLPQWGLRAEFWIEGEETNESGSYLYLATDQVRFHRMDAEQVSAHAKAFLPAADGKITDPTITRQIRV